MKKYNLTDTIAAISTPIGDGGIGIVRISGKDALRVGDTIFSSKDQKKPSDFVTYTTHYGWVRDAEKIIDEVILTVMRAPRTYTKEDVVEINCHGGIVALRAVLDLVVAKGCRLAEPGEFTKRAFLNGRIDLAQAEAVLDIISAKTDSALKMSVEQLKGGLSKKIRAIMQVLIALLAELEAHIDFPEEEIGQTSFENVKKGLTRVESDCNELLESAKQGKVFREGIHTVICGKPNVGKSSLLNALLKEERSIVTPVAGTTRDTIEEVIDIKGIPVRIVDTAGILEPRDLVEKKAVARSKQQIESADLVILMFDAGKRLANEDRLLIKKLKKKTTIAVINKIDVAQKLEKKVIVDNFRYVIGISAKKATNIHLLENAIADLVYKGKVPGSESVIVNNARHISALRQAQKLIAEAQDSLDNKLSSEFIAQDIKEALTQLDGILGKHFSEDLLDTIFSEFCIGK